MRVTMFWHGGVNYACFDTHDAKDAEGFDTLADAVEAFRHRAQDRDPYYPCVEDSAAWLMRGPPEANVGVEYPDWTLRLGPRGGVIRERA